jgi:polysaccharide biosynthesis protein PslH
VADAKAFMQSHDIMIVPLLTAGGIRVKTIEGMALQKAIVTTSIGLEGIDAVGGTQVEIADEPEDFAKAILDLVADSERLKKMGHEARLLAEKSFDNNKIIQDLVDFYTELKR